MVKGKPHTFAVKWADAATGPMKTYWEGAYPAKGASGGKYDPMRKQGAIILGIGGDNSNWAVGTFYEGAMTTGYATNATDSAVQANIVAAGYGSTTTEISGGRSEQASASFRYDPSTGTALVGYTSESVEYVRLRVVDLRGRVVAVLQDGQVQAGRHTAVWDAKQAHAGVYALVMDAEGGAGWSGKVVVGR
jgi:hypothetical protein